MSKLRSYPTCIAIGGGITALVLCYLAALPVFNPFVFNLWVGFISMMLYFSCNAHKDKRTYMKVFFSFLAGLIWGQISNVINIYVYPINPTVCYLLDYLLLVFLLLFVHIGLLGKTVFGFVPSVFFGLASTIGFYGRPDPLALGGVIHSIEIPDFLSFTATYGNVVLYQIAYCLFGLLFAFMIEVIADICAKFMLKPPAAVATDAETEQ